MQKYLFHFFHLLLLADLRRWISVVFNVKGHVNMTDGVFLSSGTLVGLTIAPLRYKVVSHEGLDSWLVY